MKKPAARALEVKSMWKEVQTIGLQQFKIKRFRPGQKALIEAALTGRDALGILPTGAGKSLTFQLPAVLLQKTTVVVSPLLALMKDQTDKLHDIKVPVSRLDSSLTKSEYQAELAAIADGHRKIVYVTPEQLEKEDVLAALSTASVGLMVVDEAHCVTQWGHDFRPAYLGIKRATKALGRPPVMALTATATADIVKEIKRELGMKMPVHVSLGTERSNIFLEVALTVSTEAKHEALLKAIAAEEGMGIIYASTVKAVEEIYEFLSAHGISCGRYHAKLNKTERGENQQRFMANDFKVLVATKAFGMGIDKADLRYVIHYNFPESVESYYQEIGRSGRDGKPARALLLYQLEDKRVQSFFLGGKYPSPEESSDFYQKVRKLAEENDGSVSLSNIKQNLRISDKRIKIFLNQLEGAGVVEKKRLSFKFIKTFDSEEAFQEFLHNYDDRHRSDHEKLDMMMKYGQTAKCRTDFIRNYFDDHEEELGCNHCDNCLTPIEERLGIHIEAEAPPREAEAVALRA
jgi:ATP-dependent DNA helicase RecQ